MPAASPLIATPVAERLIALGQQVRLHRKSLRISATVAAEAAGMSRITLYRIEKGEPSVTMGAYLNAMAALGMNFGIAQPPGVTDDLPGEGKTGWIPARVRLSDYPQLKQLAWQVHGTDVLTPAEALSVYERNWRHVDVQTLAPYEQQLIDALRLAFGAGAGGKENDNHGDV
jgi:transcriptional regulator with XRE-family HTH domain